MNLKKKHVVVLSVKNNESLELFMLFDISYEFLIPISIFFFFL